MQPDPANAQASRPHLPAPPQIHPQIHPQARPQAHPTAPPPAPPPAPPIPPAPATWRLQTQLRRQLLGLLALLWLLGSAATWLGLLHETDEVLDSALTETAQRLLQLPAAAWAVPDTTEHLAVLGPHEEFVVYQVYDRAGALVLRSHDAPSTALDAGAPDGLRQRQGWRVLTLTTANASRRAQVAERVAHRREVLWASLGWLLGMLLAMLPLAALGMGWVLRRGFQALEPARLELAQRAQHDLRPLPLADAPAELQPWLATVNSLLDRVRGLVDSERAFAANTAHELRTPLAAAMAQAQRLVRLSTDPAKQHAAHEAAQALLRQLDRLTRLATRLLQLARIESGAALNHAPVDLVQLVVLVADDFGEAQRSGRLQLQVDGQPMPVQGDIDALGIALRNLIDNALKHGDAETTVTVRVSGQQLQVLDDGPGVAPHRVAGLVRKFERGSSGAAVSGNGLGLALVDTIARQSGARLQLHSPVAHGRGFCASIHFDAEPDATAATPRRLQRP